MVLTFMPPPRLPLFVYKQISVAAFDRTLHSFNKFPFFFKLNECKRNNHNLSAIGSVILNAQFYEEQNYYNALVDSF